jgi:hypothetical protein
MVDGLSAPPALGPFLYDLVLVFQDAAVEDEAA